MLIDQTVQGLMHVRLTMDLSLPHVAIRYAGLGSEIVQDKDTGLGAGLLSTVLVAIWACVTWQASLVVLTIDTALGKYTGRY